LSARETHRIVSVLSMMGIASLNPSYELSSFRGARSANPESRFLQPLDSGLARFARAPE
jgi:hypothetical protein